MFWSIYEMHGIEFDAFKGTAMSIEYPCNTCLFGAYISHGLVNASLPLVFFNNVVERTHASGFVEVGHNITNLENDAVIMFIYFQVQ